ncbi:MAG: family 78 glycoside hydrolase catalytic domain [Bacteroidales bacterium]|nr:family 78 glycoside hydrolase catalytic domain [Bacteroidales bacterium]
MKYRLLFFLTLAATSLLLFACNDKLNITITNPNVEQQVHEQPLATAQPRFSWNYGTDRRSDEENPTTESEVMQQNYRIIVATTAENAQKGIGDLWDSGVVPSSQMLYIPYAGKELKSRDKAYWKVITTVTAQGGKKAKLASNVKSFEISLLNQDDWQAKWIGHEFEDDVLVGKTRLAARYLRKEFALKSEVSEARLYVSGMGVYSAYLNGQEIAPDELLKPTLSWYSKRVYFNTYDVTKMLQQGDNAVGIILEGGRYTSLRYNAANPNWDGTDHVFGFGTPRLLLQLEVTYKDGQKETIVSDETWKITNRGPIRTANEWDGETYDENFDLGDWNQAEYDDSAWLQAELVDAPEGQLSPQPNPNIKVMGLIIPYNVFKKGDKWIIDMGQNMVGVLYVDNKHFTGLECGDTVMFRYAETLNSDSTLFTKNLRSAECTDYYIASKTPANDWWKPMFVYHGFRYVEITGLHGNLPTNLEWGFIGLPMYDEMPMTGEFITSNKIINAVYKNATRGIRGNYRSMPTDCPQRDERMGWTGDRTTGNYGESYIFNNHQLYAKWLTDGDDSQWDNGSLANVIPPYWRGYTDNMTWPGAMVTVTDMLYTRFGDLEPIRQHYAAWKKWMLHMKNDYMRAGLMPRDTYGDWCMPPESLELIHSNDATRITDATVISTPFYCYLCGKMAKFAEILGFDEDVTFFQKEITTSTIAFNDKYFNRVTGVYANNTVTANILPLWFGMVPKGLEDKVMESIVDKTENECGGHVSTGVVGIQQLMRCLTEYGHGDLALKIASNDSYPSWGYMYRNGATTIWELWNGNTADPAMNSGNHVMLLGDLILWEYEYLGGIRALEPGYSKIQLKPYPIEGLDVVNCAYNSVSGRIESNWKREGKRFEWDFTIPANTTAEVCLPTANGYEVKTYGSGKYHLSSEL